MSKNPQKKKDKPEDFPEDIDDDINVDEIVKIIATGEDKEVESELKVATEKKDIEAPKKQPPKPGPPPIPVATQPPVTPQKAGGMKTEEESIEKLVNKIDEVYKNLDDLSKGIIQVDTDLRSRVGVLIDEMNRLAGTMKDASRALDQAKGTLPGTQTWQRQEQPSFAQTQPQQQGPPPSYQPSPYGYQSPPPPQQQGYYSQQPPPSQGFFQQQQPPPPPPGVSPEDAVTKGAESLRGTIFDDVVSALNQVASIVFSRLLDARERILRIDPTFPVQDFDPILSELRANPRMKLSQVDKRKVVERMLYWASRLPRPP